MKENVTKNNQLNEEIEGYKKRILFLENKIKEEKSINTLMEEKLRNEKIQNKEFSDKLGAVDDEIQKLKLDNDKIKSEKDELLELVKVLKDKINK